ncbi:sigma-54-dependent Fis family transcriptional regulator [Sphingomonas oleivorans]|uniref:Sigma-54-dependent Fis family transcriptional regulator n=1 Tax=Sphingomonas oleivorans TaxID=1735121 RepID=A0A2T5G139_9SPHN|nr:sigma-54-dependent Fis family transcriptional regulator [Sphingomonas oleivorans]PTQ12859.1 sigma-54-dependent Fis family transcriptional regulator [Sphingomonas oleivorans]
MRAEQAAHIEELCSVAAGKPTTRAPLISASWRRCVDRHKLDPEILRSPHILTSTRLREHRDVMDAFLHTARFGLETLYRQVSGLGYVLLLTDSKGVTVDFIGDEAATEDLRRTGLYLGADWAEQQMGTCAVGTCIATGEALTVHRSDHFDATHIPLTCTAAPVYDGTGRLAAVLDISALKSPSPKESQHLALQLVESCARKIENASLLNDFRHDWIIKLSSSQEFADVDPDFLLAVDDGGRIAGFNRRAGKLLEDRDGGETRGPIGRKLDEYFDCGIDDLPSFIHSIPTYQRTARLRGSGEMLFAQALPPPAKPLSSPRMDMPRPPLPEPLRALFGEDAAMAQLAARAARLVDTQMSILVQGETGTGKEHLAKAIHAASARASKAFVPVNCAALPETLIESELFGYEAGAFTGAAGRGKKGLVLEADGGTLFLDEIGDMPLAAQTRLLRVLAEREVTPVGRTRPVPVNIRVIAATHRDLAEQVRAGRFRDDLYYRLNGAVLRLPALRRRADLEWLIDRLLAARCPDRKPPRLSSAAMQALLGHDWPGNIRELVNAIDYACALSNGATITPSDLPDMIVGRLGADDRRVAASTASGCEAEELVDALRAHRWNVSAIAREWQVDRSTVHRRMRRLGIVPPNRRG